MGVGVTISSDVCVEVWTSSPADHSSEGRKNKFPSPHNFIVDIYPPKPILIVTCYGGVKKKDGEGLGSRGGG